MNRGKGQTVYYVWFGEARTTQKLQLTNKVERVIKSLGELSLFIKFYIIISVNPIQIHLWGRCDTVVNRVGDFCE